MGQIMGGVDSKCIGDRGNDTRLGNVYSTPAGVAPTSTMTKDKVPMPDQMELERRFTKVLVNKNIYYYLYLH